MGKNLRVEANHAGEGETAMNKKIVREGRVGDVAEMYMVEFEMLALILRAERKVA